MEAGYNVDERKKKRRPGKVLRMEAHAKDD